MAGDRPRICASVISGDLAAIKRVEPLADLFELRLDLIGRSWRGIAGRLGKPWVACNRRAGEGGGWQGSEAARIEELLSTVELGASVVDIELSTPGVEQLVKDIKGRADCLLSYHDLEGTPPLAKIRGIVEQQMAAGAGICKVVTTARTFADNIAVLQLIRDFPEVKVISFAMGAEGQISRVLCPLVGGYFTYASIEEGSESAAGQLAVGELRKLYGMFEGVR